MTRFEVLLVDASAEEGVVTRRARRLNRIQSGFSVAVHAGLLDVESLDCPRPPYYDADQLLGELRGLVPLSSTQPTRLIIGITSVPLAVKTSPAGADSHAEWDEDYFGYWSPPEGGAAADGEPVVGIVSTAAWTRRYEASAYRTTEQFLEVLVAAFLGDVLYRSKLTHKQFRRCVFDYNEDLDSIVDSVRRARFCRQCLRHLRIDQELGSLAKPIGAKTVSAALVSLAADARRPRLKSVLQALQQDGTFSVLILGLLAAIGVNVLSSWVPNQSRWQVIVPVALLGVLFVRVLWEYFRPGPPLRG